MEYVPPIGGAPGDPYVDGDSTTEGSPVPAAAIEHGMREIVAAIVSAGLTPDGGDLAQLAEAIALIAAGASAVEAGRIGVTARSSAPAGWLLCDGSLVSRAAYAGLFSAIGEDYGAGDGSTTFGLPDCKGRVIIGAGTGSGLTLRNLAAKGGVESVELTAAQNGPHTHTGPAHTHTTPAHTHPIDPHDHTTPAHLHSTTSFRVLVTGGPSPIDVFGSPGAGSTGPAYNTASGGAGTTGSGGPTVTQSGGSGTTGSGGTGATGSSGAGDAHTNMQPWIAMNVIIKT